MEDGTGDNQTSSKTPPQANDVGPEKRKTMAMGDWNMVWSGGSPIFHRKEVHNLLSKHIDKLIAGRSELKCFIPLCGKSVDMKWLYDLGHSVVGVEFCQQAIEEFFAEQKIEYSVSPCDAVQGKCYKSVDGRMILYSCDIYNFNNSIEGKFDAIWDRGSFGSINRDDSPKYTELLKSLMAKDCRTLLDTFEYNPLQYAGPPHYIPEYQIYNYYEDKCQIERVEFNGAMKETKRKLGLDSFYEKLHLLIAKE